MKERQDKMTRQNKTRHDKKKKEMEGKEDKEGREGGRDGGKMMSDRSLNFPDYGREECQL